MESGQEKHARWFENTPESASSDVNIHFLRAKMPVVGSLMTRMIAVFNNSLILSNYQEFSSINSRSSGWLSSFSFTAKWRWRFNYRLIWLFTPLAPPSCLVSTSKPVYQPHVVVEWCKQSMFTILWWGFASLTFDLYCMRRLSQLGVWLSKNSSAPKAA